jgi:hypothetical protein
LFPFRGFGHPSRARTGRPRPGKWFTGILREKIMKKVSRQSRRPVAAASQGDFGSAAHVDAYRSRFHDAAVVARRDVQKVRFDLWREARGHLRQAEAYRGLPASASAALADAASAGVERALKDYDPADPRFGPRAIGKIRRALEDDPRFELVWGDAERAIVRRFAASGTAAGVATPDSAYIALAYLGDPAGYGRGL